MDLGLKGKRVLVTGGTKSIGRAIVDTFLAEGAVVGFCARDEKLVKEREKDWQAKQGRVQGTALDVTDDKSLDKHVRKQRQIEHAPHISKEAKLVKLADKICNLRDILASPPADWSPERKQGYFDWAAKVVAGVRGVHPELEAVFDGLLARHAELR